MKYLSLTICTAAILSACATTGFSANQHAAQAVEPALVTADAAAAKSDDTALPSSDTKSSTSEQCAQLYNNYDVAMAQFAPKKKKKSFFGKLANAAAGAGGIAGVGMLQAGVDVDTVRAVNQGANMINTANAADNYSTLMNATNVIEVNRTAYRLAMENNCDVSELEKITKKYSR